MINKFKNLLKVGGALAVLIVSVGCESELDNLGEQLFDGNSAEGVEKSFGVIGFNVDNHDVMRSDAGQLGYATLGAFTEPVFGMQKANFVSQVRMSIDGHDFGVNPVMDSVVMVITPVYHTDSVTTTTNENFVYPVGNVDSKKVVNTYVVTKYGKTKVGADKRKLTIKVKEVNDFLGSISDEVKSNKMVAVGSQDIGSKEFDGTVNSVVITKKSDNTELINRSVNIRVPLDKDFFQTKILDKNKSSELANASNFIRYFKGLQISIQENDGYIFKFDPNTVSIRLYYKSDITTDGVVKKTPAEFDLTLGGQNAKFSQVVYDRTNSNYKQAIDNITETGQPQLFSQGMGGGGFAVRIPAQTIATLRQQFVNDKAGILSAKIRLYTDTSIWDNKLEKPKFFTVLAKGATTFLPDITTLSNVTNYSLIKHYDTDKALAYYDIGITKTLKDIIESGAEPKDLIVNMGSFLTNTTGGLIGVNATDIAYTPTRIVFKGTDLTKVGQEVPKDFKNIQLKVAYSKK